MVSTECTRRTGNIHSFPELRHVIDELLQLSHLGSALDNTIILLLHYYSIDTT